MLVNLIPNVVFNSTKNVNIKMPFFSNVRISIYYIIVPMQVQRKLLKFHEKEQMTATKNTYFFVVQEF